MTTDPNDLRQRIARVLTTTSRAEWPYTPTHEKWDHHKHGDQPGHTYSISCALCTGDVDRLADVLAAVLPPPADRAAVLRDLVHKAEEWDGHITVQELRRLADEAQPEPPVHGESVAHLAGLHDDEPAVDARQDGAQRCPAKHGALGRICELPSGHPGMHTGSGANGSAVWDGDAP